MTASIPSVALNSGPHTMPVIGLGPAAIPNAPSNRLASILMGTIEASYRHFDMAATYGSKAALGQAIAKAMKLGLRHSLDELFVKSKLWCTDAHPDLVLPALKKSLMSE